MTLRSDAGQASAEYTALVAVVAAALAGAGAGAAGGLDGVGRSVVAAVRTGICIVGGDVCRASDAAAAGLAPCTVGERTERSATKLTIVSWRIGASGAWTVAERSDGTFVVTRTDGRSAGVGIGVGTDATPFRLKFGAKATYDLAGVSGRSWELPDAAAARQMLAADGDDRPPPTWRFGDLGAEVGAKLGATISGTMITGLETSGSAAAGARIGRDRTTLYVRARLDGPAPVQWLPGGRAKGASAGTGDLLVELSRERGELREIAFRSVQPGGRDGELVETVGRLDLRVPANRVVADRLLSVRLPWPPAVADDLRAVVRRTVQAGVIERAVYAVEEEPARFEMSARLGIELGLQADRAKVHRRLVSASAWVGGSGERERLDCTRRVLSG